MIALVMSTYGQPYREIMQLPMRVFWAINGFIPRVVASKALMDLQVFASAQSEEGIKDMASRLEAMSVEPIKRTTKAVVYASAQRDEAGIARLRAMTMMQ